MRVLIFSTVFLPSYGGLEQMVNMVALALVEAGHQVTVATNTTTEIEVTAPYRIVRQPSHAELTRQARVADVCVLANLPLSGLPVILLKSSRTAAMHQGYYWKRGNFSFKTILLKFLMRRVALNIACSSVIAAELPPNSIVIPNCYDQDIFQVQENRVVDRDVVFVGRLVSDKGGHYLLDAMRIMADKGRQASLTVVGSGPELEALRSQAAALGLATRVQFTGPLDGTALSEMMGRHKLIVVPSVVEEGFGIVALEGIASGCVAIGTDGGGLPEAIGPCGMVVKRSSPGAIAAAMSELLASDALRASYREPAAEHLRRHSRSVVGARFVEAIDGVSEGRAISRMSRG